MCGLFGYVCERPRVTSSEQLLTMLAHVRRRGPDDEGALLGSRVDGRVVHAHTDGSAPSVRMATSHVTKAARGFEHDCALLHCRYSLIDLSAAGHQPFSTEDGAIWVAFQGEIFNYVELRDELSREGVVFETKSDTEVLAYAYERWGGEAWSRLNGFWAAAIFDRRRRRIVLCRDRLGIAPLYVAESDGSLFFGSSSLGVARTRPGGPRPNEPRVRQFIDTGLKDFDGLTLFEGVRSLAPGVELTLGAGSARVADGEERRFWAPPRTVLGAGDISLTEAADGFRDLLAGAVELRLRTDRSVAYQLSGGLDSASVVALAGELSAGSLATYTVSVPEEDEAPLAGIMEEATDLRRQVLRGLEAGLVSDARGFARLMEEPVQAPNAYGHHVMCRRMRADGYGVALSGSGGDEVLAGYEWDFWPAARILMQDQGRRFDAALHDWMIQYGTPARAARRMRAWAGWGRRLPGRLMDAARALGRRPAPARDSSRRMDRDETAVVDAYELSRRYDEPDYVERRIYHLERAHLPYYLASNDHATLGIPLEHRQPFLDHRVVEFGMRLPPGHLFHRGWTKYVLRLAMRGLVPEEILWRRRKTGFPFPVRRFLLANRGPLEGAASRPVEVGLVGPSTSTWADQIRDDPLRVWRLCSTGFWLEIL